jgi:H/ACA ribonucleoprotein complex subunit 3
VFSQPTYLGDLLSSYTHIWVGSRFGFGFYQAGHLRVAFVFDANKPGINDRVQLPSCPGHLTHSACLFSQTDAWLFLTTQNQGQIYHTCAVIGADGTIVATAQAQCGTDHWLATVGQSGERGCAIANALLVPTDEGIIRIDRHPGQLMHTKTFADTEPFVDSNTRLLPAPQGLYGVNAQDIYQLAIA